MPPGRDRGHAPTLPPGHGRHRGRGSAPRHEVRPHGRGRRAPRCHGGRRGHHPARRWQRRAQHGRADHRTRATARSTVLSVASGSHLLGASGLALHPAMPKLAARYASGKVAVVNGVGNPAGDLSHFSSMATWMAGTAGTAGRPAGSAGSSTPSRTGPRGCGPRGRRHHAAAPGGGALERHLPRRAERALRLLHRRRLGACPVMQGCSPRACTPPGSARSPTRSAPWSPA